MNAASSLMQEVSILADKMQTLDVPASHGSMKTPVKVFQSLDIGDSHPQTPNISRVEEQEAFLIAASPILQKPAPSPFGEAGSHASTDHASDQQWATVRLLDHFMTAQTKEVLNRVRSCERAFLVLHGELQRVVSGESNGTEHQTIGVLRWTCRKLYLTLCADEISALIAYATSRAKEMSYSLGHCIQGLSEDLAVRYRSLLTENQRLLTRLHKSRGNILVYCRVRPPLPSEQLSADESIVEVINDTELVFSDKCECAFGCWLWRSAHHHTLQQK